MNYCIPILLFYLVRLNGINKNKKISELYTIKFLKQIFNKYNNNLILYYIILYFRNIL
jgi:hypothetical protein